MAIGVEIRDRLNDAYACRVIVHQFSVVLILFRFTLSCFQHAICRQSGSLLLILLMLFVSLLLLLVVLLLVVLPLLLRLILLILLTFLQGTFEAANQDWSKFEQDDDDDDDDEEEEWGDSDDDEEEEEEDAMEESTTVVPVPDEARHDFEDGTSEAYTLQKPK